MDKRPGYQCPYIVASLILTGASIAIGIAFFSPYWLQNVGLHPEAEQFKNYTRVSNQVGDNVTRHYPNRGLWAQCGAECVWFWSSDYWIQKQIFTPLRWHIACQVLYAVAGFLMLFCEIYARVQMCCSQKSKVVLSLAIIVLISALLQIATYATFGGGAWKDYGAISDPRNIVKDYSYLGSAYWESSNFNAYPTYIGWSFWIGVVGSIMCVISSVFFLITYCGLTITCGCCPCCDE